VNLVRFLFVFSCATADFGLCQPVSEGMVIQGTPSFLSPEFIIEWFHGNKHAKFSQAAGTHQNKKSNRERAIFARFPN
jgi:hypothetical protein